MLKHNNKPGSLPLPKKEAKPPSKNNKGVGHASGTSQESNIEKDASPNFFEDHIRGEKKEGP